MVDVASVDLMAELNHEPNLNRLPSSQGSPVTMD